MKMLSLSRGHLLIILTTLSDRSRDNLPNPQHDGDHVYVPRNMPAIGDLFDMFNFDHDRNHDHDQDDRR
jgi:phospholipase C